MKERLARLFAYDDWANREVAASLSSVEDPPARSVRLLAHIVGAERLWLSRLTADGEKVAVWPELDLAECGRQIAELSARWRAYLGALSPERLSEEVAYVNSKGEPWTSAVEEILLHVVLHSGYHRGQIALDMRTAGATPAYTDFIHAVRQRRIG